MTTYFDIERHETQKSHHVTDPSEEIPGVPGAHIRILRTEASTLTPADENACSAWDGMTIVTAEPDEVVEWDTKWRLFDNVLAEAAAAAVEAETEYKRRMAEIYATCAAAWKDYESVHDMLDQRAYDLQQEYDDHQKRLVEERRAQAQAQLAEREKEHGPRSFAIRRPSDNRDGRGRPDMDRPTIHVDGCMNLERGDSAMRYRSDIPPLVHADEAILELVSGTPQRKSVRRSRSAHTDWVTDENAPLVETKVCKTCGADKQLAEYDPATYANWLRRVSEVQPPTPTGNTLTTMVYRLTEKTLYSLEGDARWSDPNPADVARYRGEERIFGCEVLIVTVGPRDGVSGKSPIRELDDELASAAVTALADLGYSARRPLAPHYGNPDAPKRVSREFLAVRRMTGAERQAHRAAKKTAK